MEEDTKKKKIASKKISRGVTSKKKAISKKKVTSTKKKSGTTKKKNVSVKKISGNGSKTASKKNTNKKSSYINKKESTVKKKNESLKEVNVKNDKVGEKKTNKKTKVLLDIIIYVFIVVVMICLVLLYFKKREDTETIKEIKETVVPKEIEIVDEKTVKDYISDLQIKFNNSDIKGILNIDGLDVSIPIVKGKDNDYYLKHAVNKKKSVIGSVFIDYRNNTNSKQINIYGHNSTKFNTPFKVLEGYLNKDYYNEHKYFEFMVNDEVRKYEIFSVIVADKDSSEEHMQFSYKKNSDWLKHFQRLQKKSKYKINVTVNKDDKIMVLQTCIFGRYHDKLLVIVGREIERK